ncbi:hypothetical protein FEM48_Zijuj01G0092000 [Ziziphus jujuba var. spinosa]|uniref:Coiled-coil domain-containing protein 22 homolog n=1 Tax=Ziziphus jujuba var. spinosa TaxID=714518 RepID=A0A978W0D6_ZIZJJ|nr:hypothetical protein FEM48_Zijuj01G0092000 [Ziziphus jujuba var. spinosa]
MEESQEILLKSLENSGVCVPNNVFSIPELKPTTLVSICGQALNLIDDTVSFPTSLPDSSVAEQVKICTDIAARIKNLGYLGDMSFHQLLYPSEEDLYKLVRFLVERLSESSEGGRLADVNDVIGRRKAKGDKSERHWEESTRKLDENGADIDIQKIGGNLDDLRLISEVMDSLNSETGHAFVSKPCDVNIIPQEKDEMTVDDESRSSTREFNNGRQTNVLSLKDSIAEPLVAGQDAPRGEETAIQGDDKDPLVFEKKVASSGEQSSKIRNETQTQCQEKVFLEEVIAKASDLHHLEEELEMLKAAAEMAFNNQHPVDFYLEQLKEKVDTRKHHLVELKSQWEVLKKPLEEEKEGLQQILYANVPQGQEKLQKLRELELEKQSFLSDIEKREDELSKLSTDLEKQPKVASRKSYIERIKEITKNSRKQDADIERILKDTRELQLESNSIQERLHRTYAVVDEMVFREAKKDTVGKQAYRLLTSIHESFEQISEKIMATDRIRREVAQREKKLAAIASRSLNIDKLQADLDVIKRENEHLENWL